MNELPIRQGAAAVLVHLPPEDLKLSATGAQAERRKRFDKGALKELADSITSIGLQQPIVVRRVNGHYEVVAGERRVLAARQAKIERIDAIVRELDDGQVLEVQLIENLQREGLHELVEAEGYETLMKRHRFTVDDLVAKVGKSKAYVYARLKLCALCPEARKAFYDGKLNASTALLIARIPIHDLQRQALKEITAPRWGGEPMHFRDAARHVRDTYMLELGKAPFPTGDAELVPAAGPCGACPKRTGNQKELFGDVKGADVCTDPVCFAAKKDANLVRLAAKAKASGKEVISGAEAKKIAPDGVGEYSDLKAHVRLDDRFWSGNKQKTYRSAIGKDVEVKHLQDPESGKLVEIAAEAEVRAAMKKRGIKDGYQSGGGGNDYQAQQRARERKAKIERQFRQQLYAEIRQKLPAKLGRAEILLVGRQFIKAHRHDQQKELLKVWGLDAAAAKTTHGWNCEKPLGAHLDKASDTDLARYVLDLAFLDDLLVFSYGSSQPELLLAAAKRHKVNASKIRRDVTAAAKPKGKKKSARKAK